MERRSQIIPVELSDGTIVKIEATPLGEQKVSFRSLPFKEATIVIRAFARDVATSLQEVSETAKPDKISVKMGFEVAVESGQLTALIVKGSGKANLEISMEWSK
jgi:tRNA U34 5-methylaminomethyl-2-thiouridine-forming methyltransferase MnmC